MLYFTPSVSDLRFYPYPGTYAYNYDYQTRVNPYFAYPGSFQPISNNDPLSVRYPAMISKAEADLNQAFRLLWEQHVAWTRMTITSIATDSPDEEAVTERLLRNPSDMAVLFQRYYGNRVASKFSSLLREHLVIAAQLVKAAKVGHSQEASETEKRWYANADEIATFLSSINPNWPKSALMNMLHQHLRLTKTEAVLILSKKYKEDIEAFDQIEIQALEMADAFTNGIVKQFPKLFKK